MSEEKEKDITLDDVIFPGGKIKAELRGSSDNNFTVRDRDELLLNAISTGAVDDLGDPRDRLEKFVYRIAEQSAFYNNEIETDRVISSMEFTKSGSIVTQVVFRFRDGEVLTVTDLSELRSETYRDLFHRVQIIRDGSDYWGIFAVLNDFSSSQPVGFYGMKLNSVWNSSPTSVYMGLLLFDINTNYSVTYHARSLT